MSTEHSLNTIANMYNAYGATLSREISDLEYYNWAKAHHHAHEDFEDGDIAERIEAYPRYELRVISIDDIDLSSFYRNADYVEEFLQAFNARIESGEPFDGMMPPLVHTSGIGKYVIADGVHRLLFLKALGLKAVYCYVNPH